jgi:putative tricarboxylic transport membrane protein
MTQQGRAAEALGLSVVSSWIGGAVGVIALLLFAPSLADLSLILGPPELFLLAVFGLSTVAAVTRGNILKSLAAVALGVFIASIGTDPILAQPRFTFGFQYLQGGINIVVLLVGLFAISQVIKLAVEQIQIDSGNAEVQGSVMSGALTALKSPINNIRSSIIGTAVGAVPGAGLPAANFLAYLVSVMSSSKPEAYGQGEPNGVIAGEAANNGSAMGSLIPAMALSIPGGPASAVFIGVMLSYGITPGPSAFEGTLPYVVFVSIILGQIVFLFIGLFAADKISKLIQLPRNVLITGITVFALVGSFAVRNNILDIGVAILFGVLGYAMERRDYSIIAFILAVILAPIAEKGYQRSMIIGDGDWGIFVSSPIAIGLVVASVAVFLTPVVFRVYRNG